MFTMNKTTHDMTITCNFIDYNIAHRLKPIVRCGYIVNLKFEQTNIVMKCTYPKELHH